MRLAIAVWMLCGVEALSADQVTLKNGDVISGDILKKDGDKLTLKSAFLGEVTMPWAAVAAIKSEGPLYVDLPSGKTLSGPVATQDNALRVENQGTPQTVPLSDVTSVRGPTEERKFERLQHPGWLELWAGYFDLGLALTRGNSRTDTFNTSFNASRPTRNDKTSLYFTQIYSTARLNGISNSTADAVRGGVSYDHNVTPRLFLSAFNNDEYDKFQGLDLRFVAGGGAGFHAVKEERAKIDLLGGADYDRDAFSNHLTRKSAEAFFGDDLGYKISGTSSLTQSLRIFENLSDTGQYRINFDLGAQTTLKKWLSWQVTASDRFLSNPVFGRQRNDLLLTTGFRVSFAR